MYVFTVFTNAFTFLHLKKKRLLETLQTLQYLQK